MSLEDFTDPLDDEEKRLNNEINQHIMGEMSGRQAGVVRRVVDEAQNMDPNMPMADRRLKAQKQVADSLGYGDYQSVQDFCGRRLFRFEHEYVPANKWQQAFTQLLENIERDRMLNDR